MVVFSCCRRGQIPISLATCTASKRTSTGYPPSRRCGARSIMVGLKPYRLSQYARVGPAILAPEMRIVVFLLIIMVVSFEMTTRAETLNEASLQGKRLPSGEWISLSWRKWAAVTEGDPNPLFSCTAAPPGPPVRRRRTPAAILWECSAKPQELKQRRKRTEHR